MIKKSRIISIRNNKMLNVLNCPTYGNIFFEKLNNFLRHPLKVMGLLFCPSNSSHYCELRLKISKRNM